MADWKTYVKAARNTASKQAPQVRDAARTSAERATRRAGDYARAAGKVVEHNRRDGAERGRPSTHAAEPDRFARNAAAYATVAQRRVAQANIVPRVLRAVRDALLIGGSLLVIWLILAAAGIRIPFSAVLVVVLVIVVLAFSGTLYSQFRRAREDEAGDSRDTGMS